MKYEEIKLSPSMFFLVSKKILSLITRAFSFIKFKYAKKKSSEINKTKNNPNTLDKLNATMCLNPIIMFN